MKVSTDEKVAEIREMAQHFNAMTYDLAHMETLRSDFVANVSHEFKMPIAAIEGYATLLQNPTLPREKHDHYVEVILDNSRRLSDLSSNILALSKLENQELIVDNREFSWTSRSERSFFCWRANGRPRRSFSTWSFLSRCTTAARPCCPRFGAISWTMPSNTLRKAA